jgi:sporulation protein YlmC with PRC-barrel domain
MRLGKDLINKPIYTLDEGKLLGKVQDLYVDDALEVILGIYLGAQGLVRRRSQLIRSGDVSVFGSRRRSGANADVITDDSDLAAAKEWLRRDKLTGRDVDTPGGTRLGVMGDVVVDANGRITGFALSKAVSSRGRWPRSASSAAASSSTRARRTAA